MPIAPPLSATVTRPRVLMLTHRVPYPPDKGDRIRTYHTLRCLSEYADVSLIALADEPVTMAAQIRLDELCEQVAILPVGRSRWYRAAHSAIRGRSLSEGAFHEPAIANVIQQWQQRTPFDSAIVSSSAMAPYLRVEGLREVPAIVDLIDVDSQKWLDFAVSARPPKRWLYQFEACRVRALECEIADWAECLTVVSRAEADVLDSFTGPGTATVAGNGVDLDYFQPSRTAETKTVVFVGAMDYLPNVDAVTWFANEIWPAIRQQHSTAGFRIVGRNPTPAVRKLAERPGIIVTGGVPDVRPLVASSSVVVAPIRIARGVQNKVLEALAMGKATVASPATLAALEVAPGRELLRAETPDQWISAVTHLLETPSRRRELGAAARQFVEVHHNWDRCLAPLLEAIVRPTSVTHSRGRRTCPSY